MISEIARGPMLGRLGFRLMVASGLALTPLAMLSYNQAQKYESEAEARWETALFGETLVTATPQIDAISRAQGLASAMATTIVAEIDDPVRCSAIMARLIRTETTLSFAGFIPPDGNMTCASTGKPYSFAGDAGLAAFLKNPKPLMTVNRKGPISGESVLIFSHPVINTDGSLAGVVSLSLPHRALELSFGSIRDKARRDGEPLALVTFDAKGTVLTALMGIATVEERLPVGRPLTEFVGKEAMTFRGTTPSGASRIFAVLPIVPGSLYVLGSWSDEVAATSPLYTFLPLWAFPLGMWVASLIAAWLAAEHQVLRHVRSLRRSITAFAGGNRNVQPPDLDTAPNELRDVGDAYERMMSAVIRNEAELEDSVHQKEVLLREVHHRVKNNLQLIASIMNLQIRKSTNPEARALLRNLHERVMSLATVHRELYQTSGLADVRADELLETIVAQVLRMGATADRLAETQTAFDPIHLTPDQAVPLSLMLTEALTNALKHAGSSTPGHTKLSVSLRRTDPDTARLEIANSADLAGNVSLLSSLESTGLGQQLMSAFASQLMGKLTSGLEGATYVMRLDFPIRPLDLAEQRNDPAA